MRPDKDYESNQALSTSIPIRNSAKMVTGILTQLRPILNATAVKTTRILPLI